MSGRILFADGVELSPYCSQGQCEDCDDPECDDDCHIGDDDG